MKRTLYILTPLLLLAYFFTAIIGEPGDFGYQLVIKPYPSLLKSVPNMEERAWERAVASGEIPEWVAARRYVVIGSGSAELRTRLWERLHILFVLFTFLCTLTSLAFILRSSMAALRRRRTA
ncbi:MAG: hypothetical protein QOG71_3857 [Pyrinomonadaceae bacterium]|nr:hypothetical protein [Pyrinomonadaceae bacterium]